MKIRKYTAKTAQEAIALVKADLGSDALIVSTKKVRAKGLFGFLKKPLTEVTAAIDEQARAKAKRLEGQFSDYAAKNPPSPKDPNDIFAMIQSQLKAGLGATNTAGKPSGASAATAGKSAAVPSGSSANTAGKSSAAVTGKSSAVSAATAGKSAAAVTGKSAAAASYQAYNRHNIASAASPANNRIHNSAGVSGTSALALDEFPDAADEFPDAADRFSDATGGFSGSRDELPGSRDEPPDGHVLFPGVRVAELESKVSKIESMMEKVCREVSGTAKMFAEFDGDERLTPLPKVLRRCYDNLIKNEVEPEFAAKIIEKINDTLLSEVNPPDAAAALYNAVYTELGKPATLRIRKDKKPTVAIFLGPTGVGKTTTLAKIAADSALNGNLKVGMITADTYRIAAVQQLKTYAEILNIPVSVVYTPEELKTVTDDFSDKDLILIDTAGRSHRNKSQFAELSELVDEAEADEVYLVLSTTTGMRNNREIIRNYGFLDDYKLIFTKADETPTFGVMLNARMLTGKQLSYVTVGQSVPDDIEVASIEKITRNLIGSVPNE